MLIVQGLGVLTILLQQDGNWGVYGMHCGGNCFLDLSWAFPLRDNIVTRALSIHLGPVRFSQTFNCVDLGMSIKTRNYAKQVIIKGQRCTLTKDGFYLKNNCKGHAIAGEWLWAIVRILFWEHECAKEHSNGWRRLQQACSQTYTLLISIWCQPCWITGFGLMEQQWMVSSLTQFSSGKILWVPPVCDLWPHSERPTAHFIQVKQPCCHTNEGLAFYILQPSPVLLTVWDTLLCRNNVRGAVCRNQTHILRCVLSLALLFAL